jgi:hypothetical protein
MVGALFCMAQRTKNIGAEIFEELQNVVLEENNGEDKKLTESN